MRQHPISLPSLGSLGVKNSCLWASRGKERKQMKNREFR